MLAVLRAINNIRRVRVMLSRIFLKYFAVILAYCRGIVYFDYMVTRRAAILGNRGNMSTTTTTTTPTAWVGCLGCYNNGALVGKWLEGESCADLEAAGLARIETHGDYTAPRCVRCGGDEFAVLDHENYGDLLDGECSVPEAQAVARAIATIETRCFDVVAVAAFASNHHLDIASFDEWVSDFEDSYIGEMSLDEYAAQHIEDTGMLSGVPDSVARYFDYEAFARDLSYDIWESNGYLFWNR